MVKNSTQPKLLQKLFELLEMYRGAFRQERVYWRAVGMDRGGDFQFRKTYDHPGITGVGDCGWGLEWLLSLVQPREI